MCVRARARVRGDGGGVSKCAACSKICAILEKQRKRLFD